MSVKNLFGSLETIALLLYLSPNNFIESSQIRDQFNHILEGTLNAKLRKLEQQGMVKIQKKKQLKRAGDDKNRYRLTSMGKKVREELTSRNIDVLQNNIEQIVKQNKIKTEKTFKNKNKEQSKNLLTKFSKECSTLVGAELLQEQIKILEKLLKSHFGN